MHAFRGRVGKTGEKEQPLTRKMGQKVTESNSAWLRDSGPQGQGTKSGKLVPKTLLLFG
jgi:hypothetical protein